MVEEEERVPDGAGDIVHQAADAAMGGDVRVVKVARERDEGVVRIEALVDMRLVPEEEGSLVEGAVHAAIVGVELEACEIVGEVDRQVHKGPVLDALAALAAKARDRVEDDARWEVVHVDGFLPVWLVSCIVALIAQGVLVRQDNVAMPWEEATNIMNPF